MSFILSIDQGTSGTKTLVVDASGQVLARGIEPLYTHHFGEGFVEQDPIGIYKNVIASVTRCLADLLSKGGDENTISAVGISNQRETFVLWDKQGMPLCPAVVWQCKRSAAICAELKKQGLSEQINAVTGLIIDPYFSATKLIWLARHNAAVKTQLQRGNIFFGTVDTWLLYKLTNGNSYYTDHTNASRTLFFNIHSLQWDQELLQLFGLSKLRLPGVKHSSAYFGATNINGLLKKEIPVAGMIGDSHAAAFGEGCFTEGSAKATLGTGCSILMNIGHRPLASKKGMVTTINWSIKGRVDYALEGVIVTCGAALEWLKNELQLFIGSSETSAMAESVADNGGVYLVPAFSGLGSPHWQMDRKASLTGMSFGTTKNHIVRAALESVAYQVKDVIAAMEADTGIALKELMTNGGLTANNFVMQFMADVLDKPVYQRTMADVSALGAAYMAGLEAGIFQDLETLANLEKNKKQNRPASGKALAAKGYKGWLDAIAGKI